jgi:hypothetical protein
MRAQAGFEARLEAEVQEQERGGGEQQEQGEEPAEAGAAVEEGRARQGGGVVLMLEKLEGIAALGQLDAEGLVLAFFLEVLIDFLAEMRSLNADEGILSGVVARGAAKDGDADLLLAGRVVGRLDGAAAEEFQQFAGALGLLKGNTGGDTGQQGPLARLLRVWGRRRNGRTESQRVLPIAEYITHAARRK